MDVAGCLGTKKDGSLRFFFDYRRLNVVMKRERWPLPHIVQIFDEVRGSTVFTTLDIFQGYWQFKIEGFCKEKTTFICAYGTFQFEYSPFGWRNSGVTFQRMMDSILMNVNTTKY